jgi:hypothetical protein
MSIYKSVKFEPAQATNKQKFLLLFSKRSASFSSFAKTFVHTSYNAIKRLSYRRTSPKRSVGGRLYGPAGLV